MHHWGKKHRFRADLCDVPSQQQVTSKQAQRGCAWLCVRTRGADVATTRRQLAPGEPSKQGAGRIATTCSAGIATKQGPCIQLCIQLCPCIQVSKSLDVAHGSGLYPLHPLDVAPLCPGLHVEWNSAARSTQHTRQTERSAR